MNRSPAVPQLGNLECSLQCYNINIDGMAWLPIIYFDF